MVALESFWYGAQRGRIWQITSCGGFARCCHYMFGTNLTRQAISVSKKRWKKVKVQQMQNTCLFSYVHCSTYIWGRIIWIYNIIFIDNIFSEIKRQVSSTNLLENCLNIRHWETFKVKLMQISQTITLRTEEKSFKIAYGTLYCFEETADL